MTKPEYGYKTDRGWHFSDLYTLKVISHSEADLSVVRDNYMGAFKPVSGEPHPSGLGTVAQPQASQEQSASTPQVNNGIIVKLAATHAGLVTRNNGFYMPDKMRAGVGTWTEHYNKPIQVHHDDHSDPIGRVIAARYVDTSNVASSMFKNHVLRDSQKREVGRADSAFFDKFISDKTSFISKLNMLKVMDSVLQDPNYQGVGYIELTAHITDPDAIQKVLDGRYITGSVGAVSDKAVCSICDTDWLESEHCGHRPGRIYDGKKCVVIAGNLEYDEYSFVNTPADRHSGVIKIENSFTGITNKDSAITYFPVFDSVMEDSINMSIDTNEGSTVAVNPQTETQVEDSRQNLVENKSSVIEDVTQKPLSLSVVIDGKVSTPEEKLSMLLGAFATLKTNFTDEFAKALEQEGFILSTSIKDSSAEVAQLTEELNKSKATVSELQDQLNVLRKELKSTYSDMTTVEDQLIAVKEDMRKLKTSKVALLSVLDGKMASESELASFTDEVLDNTLNSLKNSLDITKITDKLNSGLSRNPQEQVEAPTGLTEPVNEIKPHQPTYATQSYVDEIYRRLLLSDGFVKASAFYDEQVKLGRASPKKR